MSDVPSHRLKRDKRATRRTILERRDALDPAARAERSRAIADRVRSLPEMTDARTVMALETALAKASLTRVERRDPYKLFHRMDRAQLKALTPAFDWDTYLREEGIGDVKVANVTEPAERPACGSRATGPL